MSDEVGRGGDSYVERQRPKYLTRGATPTGVGAPVVTLTVDELERIVERAVRVAIDESSQLLVDRHGLAKRLGCSVSHIDALRKKGLPTVLVGQSVRFDPGAVVAWLKASGSAAA